MGDPPAARACVTIGDIRTRRRRCRRVHADSVGFSLRSEPLLRVHLAPFGTVDDVSNVVARARDEAEVLLRQALVIGNRVR